jgi:hypothetical protein
MKTLLAIFLLLTILNAKFIDSDLDGVEDSLDKCPNSKLFDIVDKNGCTVRNLLTDKKLNKINYSLSLGYFYSKDTTINKSYSLNFSINYNNFSAFIEASKYNIENESGIDDTTIALFYTFKSIFNYTIGAGVYLPTNKIKNNKTDFFTKIKVSYNYKAFDSYISYQKIFTKDENSSNIDSYSFALGYNINEKTYTSISYTYNKIKSTNENSQYLSLFINYYINDNVYISSTYTKGLNSNSVKQSYYFNVGYDF